MKMKRSILYTIGALMAVSHMASAQRGLPPKTGTRTTMVTNYPQHLDFLPEMVNLLKYPRDGKLR